MLRIAVRSFFVTVCAAFLFIRLLNARYERRIAVIYVIISTTIAGGLEYRLHVPYILVLVFVLSAMGAFVCGERWKVSFVAAVISATLCNGMFAFSLTLAYPIKLLYGKMQGGEYIGLMFAGTLLSFLVWLLFRFQRLRNGMPFLRHPAFVDVGFGAGVAAVCFSAAVSERASVGAHFAAILLFGLLILLWWLSGLNSVYREKSQERRADRAESETEKLKKEIDQLKTQNYELSRINHAANKLIPSLRWLSENLMEAATFLDEETERYARESAAYIDKAVRDGFGYPMMRTDLPRTGVPAIDSMIAAMAERMAAEDIRFQFVIMGNARLLTDAEVSPGELAALLGDLLTNGMRAVEGSAEKCAFLHIAVTGGVCEFNVYDSGAAFPPEVISKLGKERVTGHIEDGGSGIGMEAVFEILRAHRASFMIDENVTPPYTKRVTVRFDGEGRTIIRSGREEVFTLREDRPDVAFEPLA